MESCTGYRGSDHDDIGFDGGACPKFKSRRSDQQNQRLTRDKLWGSRYGVTTRVTAEKTMSPAGDWKLHIRSSKVSPPTDSFSSHDSLDHALAAAFLLPAHEEAVRIVGPNGEMYDQAYINAERARWRRQQT